MKTANNNDSHRVFGYTNYRLWTFTNVGQYWQHNTQTIHVLYTYIYHKNQPKNVGKYTCPMDDIWDMMHRFQCPPCRRRIPRTRRTRRRRNLWDLCPSRQPSRSRWIPPVTKRAERSRGPKTIIKGMLSKHSSKGVFFGGRFLYIPKLAFQAMCVGVGWVFWGVPLLGTNISHLRKRNHHVQNCLGKKDMLVPWRVFRLI